MKAAPLEPGPVYVVENPAVFSVLLAGGAAALVCPAGPAWPPGYSLG